MSRVARIPVQVPAGIDVQIADGEWVAGVVGDAQFDSWQRGADGTRNARAIVACAGDH